MIVTNEDQLRVPCEEVSLDESEEIINKLDSELELSYMRGKPGIGLAGPQIGIHKRVAIIRVVGKNGKRFDINLVNAKIINKYNLQTFDKEGCLSFPGKFIKSKRYQEVHVQNMVEPKSFVATGLLAVCIQHELDHLDGILLPDIEI